MNCRLCRSANTGPLPFAVPESAGRWYRCTDCGSDSNANEYDAVHYPENLAAIHRANIGGVDAAREQVRSNCEWFGHYKDGLLNLDFLDVACADGAALDVMQAMGWSIHGFDVVQPDYFGPHVTVAPVFHRWLFPRRFAAVMAREVWEHVPNPDMFLHELHGVTLPGGLVQIQTPKPCDYYHPHIHQPAHLFIASPAQMRAMMTAAMLDVIDAREWEAEQPGQAYLCRARS